MHGNSFVKWYAKIEEHGIQNSSKWCTARYLSVTYIHQKGWDIRISILVSTIWLWRLLKTNYVSVFKL
jgi:hypothetical protein